MIQLIFIGIVTGIAVLFLKSYRPELASVVSVCGGILLLLFAVEAIGEVISFLFEIGKFGEIQDDLIKQVLKIVCIGYLTEFGAGIVSDLGSPSIGDKMILCGKILIVLLSIPMVKTLLSLVSSFASYLS